MSRARWLPGVGSRWAFSFRRAPVAVVIVLVAGVPGGCGSHVSDDYLTHPIDHGDVETFVTSVGTVQPLSLTNVSSQLSGRVTKVSADFNDVVKLGQPLAYLDEQAYGARVSEARAALDLARSQLAIHEAGLARAKAQFAGRAARVDVLSAEQAAASADARQALAERERQASLAKRGTASASERQNAETRYEAARAQVDAARARLDAHAAEIAAAEADVTMAEAQVAHAEAAIRQREAALAQAEVDLERTVIRAPLDGVVIRRNVEPGQTIASSLQAPTLFTLARDLRTMRVETRVDEADIGRIAAGQPVIFSVDAYPDRTFAGRVEAVHIAPELVQNVVTYTVMVAAENPDLALLPGMTAIARIRVAGAENPLRLPNAALRFRPPSEWTEKFEPAPAGSTRVWVPGGDGPRPVDVVLGAGDAAYTALAEGTLREGDAVIVGLSTER